MEPIELRQQLATLLADQAQLRHNRQEQLALLSHQRNTIQQQLLELQHQLDALIQQQHSLDEETQEQKERFARQEWTLITTALTQSRARLEEALAHAGKVEQLTAQRDTLLAGDATLRNVWNDYHSFEKIKETLLSSALPESDRTYLMTAQQRRQLQVQPLMDLEVQIKLALIRPQVEVEFPLFFNLDTAELAIVLPILQSDLLKNAPERAQWQRLVDAAEQAIFQMGKSPAWEVVEIAPGTWSGFVCIDSLAEYRGTQPVEAECERAIAQYLAQEPGESMVRLKLSVVPITSSAWKAGEHLTSDLINVAGDTAEEIVTEEVTPAEDVTIQAADENLEPESGWFTAADLRAWRQPIKVSAESKWNRPARQLRTLLLRLVAKGKIGENQTSDEQLWHGLPAPFEEVMWAQVEQMIEVELLLHTPTETGTRLVSLNPDRLDEVQNLINRTVTPLWEPMIVVSANTKEQEQS